MTMQLKTYDNYALLPDQQGVKQFLDSLAQSAQVQSFDNIRSCFITADSLKQAYLIISICFGGRELDYIKNQLSLNKDTCQQLSQKLLHYKWDESLPTMKIFETNAKQLADYYSFFHQKVFQNATEEQAFKIFNKIKQQKYLYGVKIRIWPYKDLLNKKIKRENQKAQQSRVDGVNYLLLTKGRRQRYNIGFLHDECTIDKHRESTNTVLSKKQQDIPEFTSKDIDNNYSLKQQTQIPIKIQQLKPDQQNKQLSNKFSSNNQINKIDFNKNNTLNKSSNLNSYNNSYLQQPNIKQQKYTQMPFNKSTRQNNKIETINKSNITTKNTQTTNKLIFPIKSPVQQHNTNIKQNKYANKYPHSFNPNNYDNNKSTKSNDQYQYQSYNKKSKSYNDPKVLKNSFNIQQYQKSEQNVYHRLKQNQQKPKNKPTLSIVQTKKQPQQKQPQQQAPGCFKNCPFCQLI